MAIEIERKFLTLDQRWRSEIVRSVHMRQAYLGGEGVSIRVRVAGELATINIKENRLGFKRQEFEYPIPLQDALDLAELSNGGEIVKTRHYVRHDGLTWEIDEFEGHNEGLVVAEVELDSENRELNLPFWIDREVTDEERYYNVTLAKKPYRLWREDEG